MEEFIIGRNPVREALKARTPLNKIWVEKDFGRGSLNELIRTAKSCNIPVQMVPRSFLDKVSGQKSHQGVLASVAVRHYAEFDDLLNCTKQHAPFFLMLDEIMDPQNFGALLRVADAVGMHGVVVPKRRAAPLTIAVAKASSGALEHVPIARVSNMAQAIASLKNHGVWVIGAVAEKGVNMWEADLTGPLCLVAGNEGQGLGRLVRDSCDLLLNIPMFGSVSSLNVSAAVAIIAYEALRQRRDFK